MIKLWMFLIVGFLLFCYSLYKLGDRGAVGFTCLIMSMITLSITAAMMDNEGKEVFKKICLDNGGSIVITQDKRYGCLLGEEWYVHINRRN